MAENFQEIRRMYNELQESPQNPALFQTFYEALLGVLNRNNPERVRRKGRDATGRRRHGSFLACLVPEQDHRDVDIQFESHYMGDSLYLTAGDLIGERGSEGIDTVELQTRRKHGLFGTKVPKYVRFSGDGHVYKFGLEPFDPIAIHRFLNLIKGIERNPSKSNSDLEDICTYTCDFVDRHGERENDGGGYCFKQDGTRLWATYTQEPNDALSVSVAINAKEVRATAWVIRMPQKYRVASLVYDDFRKDGADRLKTLEAIDVPRH